jgi:ABC-type phosphate transport system auxiliary subunit
MPRFLAELEAAVSEVERCLQELRLRNRILQATGDLENRHLDELRVAYDRLNEITGQIPRLLDD